MENQELKAIKSKVAKQKVGKKAFDKSVSGNKVSDKLYKKFESSGMEHEEFMRKKLPKKYA